MKRHPALQPHSRAHHQWLLHARALRWALEGHRHAAPLREVVAALRAYGEGAALVHMAAEETHLFPHPAVQADPTLRALAARLQEEHRWLRAQLPKIDVMSNPIQLRLVSQCLHDHVRQEERQLFQVLQARLDDAALIALGRALQG